MASLTAALGTQSNQMTASGVTVGSWPTPITIDSETLDITGGSGTSADPYSITRGTFGTARASHANGASITVGLGGGGGGGGSISITDGTTTVDPATSLRLPVGTLVNLGSGAAGVGLVLQLIGPFHVHFDDAGIQDAGGIVLAPLATGVLVLKAWAFVFTQWAGGSFDSLNIMIGATFDNIMVYDAQATSTPTAPGSPYIESLPPTPSALGSVIYMLPLTALVQDATTLNAYVNTDAPSTAGSADIYAIIAAPAS